ncbi:hypothetical protein ACWOE3_11910 [Enterococcus dispar]|uniref:hypothetical protein n=1 Tax=Enterococcus TaxID=1350 RepID=UPI0012DFCD20|nr:hypothetical protein [Enterococcus dispar]MCU7356094.1 hypothetical protein [Enterococcus dispar]WCG33437.1 hypothetical protein PML78_01765 [Enterococcus dispar]
MFDLGGEEVKVQVQNKNFHYQLDVSDKMIQTVTLIFCGTLVINKLIKVHARKK